VSFLPTFLINSEGPTPRGPAASSSAMACHGNAIPTRRVPQPKNPVVQLGEEATVIGLACFTVSPCTWGRNVQPSDSVTRL